MTRTNRILLGVVVAAAALAAYWMLVLSPKREEAAQLETQIAAQRTQLQEAERQVARYEQARGSYRVNYATVVRLGKAVPADDDVRSLLVQLESAAEATNVDFRLLQVGSASGSSTPAGSTTAPAAGATTPPPGAVSVGTAGFSTMPFTLGFRGSYANLSAFFTRLERYVTVKNERVRVDGRLLRLENLSLKPDSERGWPHIRAQINASSYLVAAGQDPLAGASPAGLAPARPAGAQPATNAGNGPATPPTTPAVVTGAAP